MHGRLTFPFLPFLFWLGFLHPKPYASLVCATPDVVPGLAVRCNLDLKPFVDDHSYWVRGPSTESASAAGHWDRQTGLVLGIR